MSASDKRKRRGYSQGFAQFNPLDKEFKNILEEYRQKDEMDLYLLYVIIGHILNERASRGGI